jgi:hypothetical protein
MKRAIGDSQNSSAPEPVLSPNVGDISGAASTSVQAAKNAVRARAKLVYRGAKPFLRPIASRARRYLLAPVHQDLEMLRLQLVHELAQQSERTRYDMQTMVREFVQHSERTRHDLQTMVREVGQQSEGTRQDIVRELVKDNEWLPSHLDRIERHAIASAKRVATPCGKDEILVRTEVGYVLCLASDHAVLACLIESGELERGTRLALQSLLGSGDVFVDVGAHLGLHTLAAARAMRGQGKIIAFEPFQPTADLLRRSVWMNGFSSLVEIHQTAVSNRSGQERLYLVSAII